MRRGCAAWLAAVIALVVPALGLAQAPGAPRTAVVTGTVTSATTGTAVRIASVRLVGGSASALTNDAGRYRIELPLGEQRVEVRRIGYRPATVAVLVAVGGATADVRLERLAVSLERVLVTAQDDAARRIVAAAIRRKQETRGQLHDYRYDGDVRLVVRNLGKPADSASSVLLVTQSRTSAYWEEPNQFQETIVARRQTGNFPAERNLIGVGQITNFGRDRLQIGRFELASPIADDALDRYEYHVLDTLVVDGRRVFRLSLEPKDDGNPAFAGVMDIADSTFDVTGIDVEVNNSVRLGFVRNLRYQQRFGAMNGRWMPRTIELSLELRSPLDGSQYRVERTAELSGFRFNEGSRPPGLGEYRIVVADSADRADSAVWTDARAIPLTAAEQGAFARIDSIQHAPLTAKQQVARALVLTLRSAGNPDIFHYNRVDGAYLGVANTWIDPPGMPFTEPAVKLGRANAGARWQYRAGDRVRLSESRQLWVGATYGDEMASRTTLTSPGYNATSRALFSTIDPLDYFRERGLALTLGTRVVRFVHFDAGYRDVRQMSLATAIEHPPIRSFDRRAIRSNPAIDDGRLRALSSSLTFDSRPLARQAGRDIQLGALQWTRLVVGAESSPGLRLGSDFDYSRFTVRLDRRQQSFGLGVTSLLATAGIATRTVPAQRWFGVDGGAQVLETQASPFGTLVDSSFSAPRAAVVAVQHNFDRLLFTRSGLPLVRNIPFTLAVRGSMFWTGYAGAPTGQMVMAAPYEEAGFSLGNLTPFAAPFNLSARFAWQISRYPTTPFRFSIGLGT